MDSDREPNVTEQTRTPLLDKVRIPRSAQLDESVLQQVADELRSEVIDAVSQTGGHLGAGLALSN